MIKRQKDRQHNGQKTEGQTTQWSKDRRTKMTNNDLQNTTQKTKAGTTS